MIYVYIKVAADQVKLKHNPNQLQLNNNPNNPNNPNKRLKLDPSLISNGPDSPDNPSIGDIDVIHEKKMNSDTRTDDNPSNNPSSNHPNSTRSGPYLCTGCDIYLSHEPCMVQLLITLNNPY